MIQAYRNSPIIPAHKKYMAICWRDNIYIQHNAIEGLASAGGIQGAPADACIEILRVHKISPVFKWVNDFVIFRSPSSSHLPTDQYYYDYDLPCMTKITEPLGIPWHPISKKGQDFGQMFKYLGFHWDLIQWTVSLPDEKHCTALMKLTHFLGNPRVSQKDCASLHSSLQHISFVYHNACCALSSLVNLLDEVPN